jgi:hypothetical protein
MTKSYNLVFLENYYNITYYYSKFNNDYNSEINLNNDQILYSLRNGDDFIVRKIETLLELNNQLKDYILFSPDILKSGFYSLEEIKNILDKEKVGMKYPTNFIEFFDLLNDDYSSLSNLIFLEYIYDKMIKNNYKIVHILYE